MTTVGLFGTCGRSTWRAPFVEAFEARGIPYFNPQLPEGTWTPGAVDDENRHLREDAVVVFPVTGETAGIGSLGEIGFSALQALRSNRFRQFVFLVDPTCTDPGAPAALTKESDRMRALVRPKLADEARVNPGVHLVETLDEALALTLRLWAVAKEMDAIRAEGDAARRA